MHASLGAAAYYENESVVKGRALDFNAALPAGHPCSEYNKAGQAGPWGGIAGIIAHFAAGLGLDWQTYVFAVSGESLHFHSRHAADILQSGMFTDVVAQDRLSTSIDGSICGNLRAVRHIVARGSTTARVYLCATPLPPDMQHHCAESVARTFYSALAGAGLGPERLMPVAGAFLLAQRLGIASVCFPVFTKTAQRDQQLVATGDARDANHAPDGLLQLYGPDHHHPSSAGAYLAALVQFAVLASADPRDVGCDDSCARSLGLSRTDAEQLQRLAARYVVRGRVPAYPCAA